MLLKNDDIDNQKVCYIANFFDRKNKAQLLTFCIGHSGCRAIFKGSFLASTPVRSDR